MVDTFKVLKAGKWNRNINYKVTNEIEILTIFYSGRHQNTVWLRWLGPRRRPACAWRARGSSTGPRPAQLGLDQLQHHPQPDRPNSTWAGHRCRHALLCLLQRIQRVGAEPNILSLCQSAGLTEDIGDLPWKEWEIPLCPWPTAWVRRRTMELEWWRGCSRFARGTAWWLAPSSCGGCAGWEKWAGDYLLHVTFLPRSAVQYI